MQKKIVCFGAGNTLRDFCKRYESFGALERIYRIIDNNRDAHFEWQGIVYDTYTPEDFISSCDINIDFILLITSISYHDIINQLQSIREFDGVECYIYQFSRHRPPLYDMPKFEQNSSPKIPKLLHYIWFGGKDIPEKNKRWMKTWGEKCPDYEIIRWDETNYDVSKHPYMYSAYKEKKWAFVSDYARLDIVYQYGGVYLDTDVEILRSFDDLLYDEAFCGFSSVNYVATGLGFGSVKGLPIIMRLRDYYDNVAFYNHDGSLNLDDNGIQQTTVLDQLGLLYENNATQLIDGLRIYPTDVLSPIDYMGNPTAFTKNTYSIHHFEASWLPENQMDSRKIDLLVNSEFYEKYTVKW